MLENSYQPPETNLPDETDKLLHAYFSAFANLYGIIPLYRAFRIIQKQNPDLDLTEAQFLDFASKVEQEEHFYIIAGAEDIYEGVTSSTPPMKREIIAEYLYAVDDFEGYEELKEQQGDKPFYIPDKEALLKWQDDSYTEETRESRALGDFLRSELKLKRADDIVSDLQCIAYLGDPDADYALSEVERMARKRCFSSTDQMDAFCQYFYDMFNHTRIPINRGFTPSEMHEIIGRTTPVSAPFAPAVGWKPQTSRVNPQFTGPVKAGKKPGRNDPCPCGSGKKYKKCCGR